MNFDKLIGEGVERMYAQTAGTFFTVSEFLNAMQGSMDGARLLLGEVQSVEQSIDALAHLVTLACTSRFLAEVIHATRVKSKQ